MEPVLARPTLNEPARVDPGQRFQCHVFNAKQEFIATFLPEPGVSVGEFILWGGRIYQRLALKATEKTDTYVEVTAFVIGQGAEFVQYEQTPREP